MLRINPKESPYPDSVQRELDKLVPPGMTPIVLFRVLARDERLFQRFIGNGLLDRGHLTLRQREIVILRVCANNGSEYEWGVHVTAFAGRAKLDAERIEKTLQPSDAPGWEPSERLLLRLCDSLQTETTLSDDFWSELRSAFTEEALLELLLLVGTYRTVSLLTNVLEMPLESFAARFPDGASLQHSAR
jgi:alkylhydroperoxidase family enzyme